MLIDSTFCFLIGLITASVTHPHRRLGDMVASTFVVDRRWVGTPIPQPAATYVPYAPPPTQAASGGNFPAGTYGTSLPPSAPVATPPAEPGTWAPPVAPSWGAPAPHAAPGEPAAQQPVVPVEQVRQPQVPPQQAPPPQPQWDPNRNAWIVWEPTRGQWMQWDANTSQWGPIS